MVENAGERVTEAALMLVLYWGISFAADLLESYLARKVAEISSSWI